MRSHLRCTWLWSRHVVAAYPSGQSLINLFLRPAPFLLLGMRATQKTIALVACGRRRARPTFTTPQFSIRQRTIVLIADSGSVCVVSVVATAVSRYVFYILHHATWPIQGSATTGTATGTGVQSNVASQVLLLTTAVLRSGSGSGRPLESYTFSWSVLSTVQGSSFCYSMIRIYMAIWAHMSDVTSLYRPLLVRPISKLYTLHQLYP